MTDAAPAENQVAEPTAQPITSDVMLQLVSFKLVGENYALPILDVKEIIRLADITPVPNAPAFVEGVINLRGQILPIVDLRKRFNMPPQEATDDSRIMVIEIENNVLGLIVDQVMEVLRIPADQIAPPPGLVANGIGAEYLKGITHQEDRMVILVDIQKVFGGNEIAGLSGF